MNRILVTLALLMLSACSTAPKGSNATADAIKREMDAVVQARFSRGAQADCKAGCSHCCHTRVEAMPAEVFRIARHVAARATEDVGARVGAAG